MTTKITIKHEGPDHKSVKVVDRWAPPNEAHTKTTILRAGESLETNVYDGRHVEVTETDNA